MNTPIMEDHAGSPLRSAVLAVFLVIGWSCGDPKSWWRRSFAQQRERERARVSRSSPLENLSFGLVLDLFISFRDSLDKEQDLQEDFVYTVHLL